ncbi:MAG: hypothetical protein P4L36_21370 [Holophaga sp.]|nr:hypothetical protein [Holophaga sp.]
MKSLAIVTLVLLGACLLPLRAFPGSWRDSSMGLLQGELTARFGPGQRPRIQRGLAQVARYWQDRDGGAGEFEAFVRAQFAGTPKDLDSLFERLQGAMAPLDGPGGREPREPREPTLPVDVLLTGFNPAAHGVEDCFNHKVAFAVVLNFPLATLEERIRDGARWSGRQWAEVRLAERFARRAPAEAEQEAAAVSQDGPAASRLLRTFQAARRLDPYSPLAPTRISRCFDQDLQLPEPQVRAMLNAVCASPLAARAARLIRTRLGRRLEPADLGYGGFRPGAELDALVRKRWPTPQVFARRLPHLLLAMGFPAQSGTRPAPVEAGAMDYQRFSDALGATGRAVASRLAREEAEYPLLAGVPGPAFSEALGRVVQARGLEFLAPPPNARAMAALHGFWRAYAGAGAALVDLAAWRWLYEHPDAATADLDAAAVAGAREVWNRYYATVFEQQDCAFLAADAMADADLQLPARAVTLLIAAQLQRGVGRTSLGAAMERWARLGRITPDLWMTRATGGRLEAEALLEATEAALKTLGA